MDGTNKSFEVLVKNVHISDGNNVATFIVWHAKICISLDIYDEAVFRVILGE